MKKSEAVWSVGILVIVVLVIWFAWPPHLAAGDSRPVLVPAPEVCNDESCISPHDH